MIDKKTWVYTVIAVVLIFSATALIADWRVRVGGVNLGHRSFLYRADPGDWIIETDGVYYRYKMLGADGKWNTSRPCDQAWMASESARIASQRRKWEPL